MEHKLRKHDGDFGPDGWKDCDPNYLWNRLKEEIDEAKAATGTQEIIEECADIANIAMMLADLAARRKSLLASRPAESAKTVPMALVKKLAYQGIHTIEWICDLFARYGYTVTESAKEEG
jgi:hypothetical protein